jgi:hypothetical protein
VRGSTRSSSGHGACILVALVSVLLVSLWTVARVHYAFGGNWTAPFSTGKTSRVPPELAARTYHVEGTGYDGQYYRYVAHDPLLRKGYARYLDSPQLRARRFLVPALAWLLAIGREAWIDKACIAVEMLFVGLGVYWCARLLVRRGHAAAWGLLFVIVPATLASFDRMLVDGPLTAFFAGFLLYCEEERWTRVWLLAMLAALTRDTGLVLIAALVADRIWYRDVRRAAWFAASAVPAAAWYGYLAAILPPDLHVTILGLPVWGVAARLFWLRTYPDPTVQLLLRVTDFLAVAGLLVSIVIAVRWGVQRGPQPVTISIILFAILGLILTAPSHMLDAFGYGRPVSPMLLWVMLESVSKRKWFALAPPLLVSLSVSLVFARPLVAVVSALLAH